RERPYRLHELERASVRSLVFPHPGRQGEYGRELGLQVRQRLARAAPGEEAQPLDAPPDPVLERVERLREAGEVALRALDLRELHQDRQRRAVVGRQRAA